MAVGSRWVYRETDSEGTEQRVVVTVTPRTKLVANGVEAAVVRDVVTEDGVPVEVTDDWYAQDSAGSIWYLGERTTEYENGKPASTAGSFEAGVDGAQPGVIMPAEPAAGQAYRQEYYAGEAEDTGEIVSTDVQAEVPFGHFEPALMTKDLNPLEPKVLEFKFYARGVGPVLAIGVSGSSGREELLSFRPAPADRRTLEVAHQRGDDPRSATRRRPRTGAAGEPLLRRRCGQRSAAGQALAAGSGSAAPSSAWAVPAASASSAIDSSRSRARSSMSQSRSQSPTSPKLIRPL